MATTHNPLTEAQMRAASKKHLEAWNLHDIEGILERLQPDVVWTDPTLETPAHGRDAVRASLTNTFTAFPDFHIPDEDFEAYFDVASQTTVTTWTFIGTMTGRLDTGVPATGRSVRIRGANQSRYRDGLIGEHHQYYDSYELMHQMGLLPSATSIGFRALVLADVMAGKAKKVLQRH